MSDRIGWIRGIAAFLVGSAGFQLVVYRIWALALVVVGCLGIWILAAMEARERSRSALEDVFARFRL